MADQHVDEMTLQSEKFRVVIVKMLFLNHNCRKRVQNLDTALVSLRPTSVVVRAFV